MNPQFSPLSEHDSIERGAHRKTIKPPILSTHLVLQKGQIRAKTNKEVDPAQRSESVNEKEQSEYVRIRYNIRVQFACH